MLSDWKLLPNYLKTFGPFHGSRIFCQLYLFPKSAGSLFRIKVKDRSFWLRNTRSDISIFFQVSVQREYDTRMWQPQHKWLEQKYKMIIEAGDTPIIIDAGANIGLASLWFAELFPLAKIFAVEPDMRNLEILERNIE